MSPKAQPVNIEAPKKAEDLPAFIAKLKKDHPGKKLETTASGLRYVVLKDGAGAVGKGKAIKAHYTGTF